MYTVEVLTRYVCATTLWDEHTSAPRPSGDSQGSEAADSVDATMAVLAPTEYEGLLRHDHFCRLAHPPRTIRALFVPEQAPTSAYRRPTSPNQNTL